MARAQGSLEYLIIISVVLAVSAIVVSYMAGMLGGQKSAVSVTGCKQAASDCKASKLLSSTDPCLSCDSACKDSTGAEIFDGATYCCNHGRPDMIFEDSFGCYGCSDTHLCPTGLNCINHDCLECTPATESQYCSAPTPYCVNSQCAECKDNTNCASGYICSRGACIESCGGTKCQTGQLCCSGVCTNPCIDGSTCVVNGDAACVLSKTCANPNTCDRSCNVVYKPLDTVCKTEDTATLSCGGTSVSCPSCTGGQVYPSQCYDQLSYKCNSANSCQADGTTSGSGTCTVNCPSSGDPCSWCAKSSTTSCVNTPVSTASGYFCPQVTSGCTPWSLSSGGVGCRIVTQLFFDDFDNNLVNWQGNIDPTGWHMNNTWTGGGSNPLTTAYIQNYSVLSIDRHQDTTGYKNINISVKLWNLLSDYLPPGESMYLQWSLDGGSTWSTRTNIPKTLSTGQAYTFLMPSGADNNPSFVFRIVCYNWHKPSLSNEKCAADKLYIKGTTW